MQEKYSKYALALFIAIQSFCSQTLLGGSVTAIQDIFYAQDEKGSFSFEQISAPEFSNHFIKVTEHTKPDIPKVSVYWIRFTIEPEKSMTESILDFENWAKVNLYYSTEGMPYRQKLSGHQIPYFKRDYPDANNCYFLFNLSGVKKFDFYARLEYSPDGLYLPTAFKGTLTDRHLIDSINDVKRMIIAVFIGIYVVIFFYNLFIYFSTRDHNYFLYLILLVLFMYLTANNSGYIVPILSRIPNFPDWRYFAESIIVAGIDLFALLFTNHFLDTQIHFPFWHRIFKYLIWLPFIALVIQFIAPLIGDQITNIVSLLILIWTAVVGIKSYKAGLPSSGIFLIAFGFSILGSFILIFALIGLLPMNDVTIFYALPSGSMLQIILFSIALADKINILRNENEEKKLKLIDQLKENENLQLEINHKLELRVAERTKALSEEKEKSDNLLLNILPLAVAEELKLTGKLTPKHYDQVTILFSDFDNFSSLSMTLPAAELVANLDECYQAFDNIIDKYNLEKIKTIGDAYMCAGGIPISNETHFEDAVNAALDIQEFITAWSNEKEEQGKQKWNLRIGIHSGPVIAGVVGKNKFAYDIWGDSVNIAARIEAKGAIGKVNISQSTYDLIKNKFKATPRGKIYAKNMGELEMYFVDEKIK